MRPPPRPGLLPALLLALGLCMALPGGDAQAQRRDDPPQRGDAPGREESRGKPVRMSAGEAAAIAQARHGGKVLNVKRQGDAYRVKLLQESGRVVTVTIGD